MDHKIDKQINTKTLKYFRKKQRLDQEDLALMIGVDKGTYNRWETGAQPRIREKNLKKLALALGVPPEKLKNPPPSEIAEKNPAENSVEMKLTLEIVARTYHISPRDIIDFAPYLFHIVAGASLGARKTNCKEFIDDLTAAVKRTKTYLPHVPYALDFDMDDQLLEEKEAIENHQLFDITSPYTADQTDDTSRFNPFANFLRDLSDQAPSELNNMFDVTWVNDGLPTISIPDSYFTDLTALPADHEMFQQIKEHLISGDLSPRDIRKIKVFSDNAYVHEHMNEYTDALMKKVVEIESNKAE